MKKDRKPGRPAVATSEMAQRARVAQTEALALVTARAPLLAATWDAVVRIAQELLRDERRLRATQALLFAATLSTNDGRVSQKWMAESLFASADFPAWGKDGPIASARSVGNFASAGSLRCGADVVASYLVAIYLLVETCHPCFEHHVASTLLISNPAVDEVVAKLNGAADAHDHQIRDIVQRGRNLLDYLDIDRRVHAKAIDAILDSHFFQGRVTKCETDDQIGATRLGAVRLGTSGGANRMFGSIVRLSHIVWEMEDGEALEQHLSLQTYISLGGNERLVSNGFILVRDKELILFQHKTDAKGLNISVLPLSELDEQRDWLRGIMLTVDTQIGTGALASRMAVYHAADGIELPVELKQNDIAPSAIVRHAPDLRIGHAIREHLVNEGPLVVGGLDKADSGIDNWERMRDYVVGGESRAREFEGDLRGYKAAPIIRALW